VLYVSIKWRTRARARSPNIKRIESCSRGRRRRVLARGIRVVYTSNSYIIHIQHTWVSFSLRVLCTYADFGRERVVPTSVSTTLLFHAANRDLPTRSRAAATIHARARNRNSFIRTHGNDRPLCGVLAARRTRGQDEDVIQYNIRYYIIRTYLRPGFTAKTFLAWRRPIIHVSININASNIFTFRHPCDRYSRWLVTLHQKKKKRNKQ